MEGERFKLRSAVYLFLKKGNKILLLRRFNTGWMDGKYSLVAGHLDGNETVTQAMVREAMEEAKIIVKKEDLVPAVTIHRKSSDQEYADFFFVCEKWEGEIIIGEPDKCDELNWFDVDSLPKNLLPHVKEAWQKYQNKIPFFESGWSN